MMNAYEYAMKLEKDGENFYRELAAAANEEGLRKIFTMLANEEVKHYKLFEKLANDSDAITLPKMEVYTDAKKIFEDMQKISVAYDIGDQQIDFYRRAVESEDKAYELYLQKADEVSDPKHKEIFLRIAQEELKHKDLLENILEFVERPTEWLESAEFYKIGD